MMRLLRSVRRRVRWLIDVGDVDGDCYGGIDGRGGFGVSVDILAVGDADGYGVGLRGLVVQCCILGHGDLSCGRVDGELVRACQGIGECVVFRVSGCDRGAHAGRRRRIFGHFSHQAAEVRAWVGEGGRQVGRVGSSRSSVGPGAVTFVVLGQDLHFVGGPGLQAADCGGGRRAGEVVVCPVGFALLAVLDVVVGDGWAGVGRGCPAYIQSGLGGR